MVQRTGKGLELSRLWDGDRVLFLVAGLERRSDQLKGASCLWEWLA